MLRNDSPKGTCWDDLFRDTWTGPRESESCAACIFKELGANVVIANVQYEGRRFLRHAMKTIIIDYHYIIDV